MAKKNSRQLYGLFSVIINVWGQKSSIFVTICCQNSNKTLQILKIKHQIGKDIFKDKKESCGKRKKKKGRECYLESEVGRQSPN